MTTLPRSATSFLELILVMAILGVLSLGLVPFTQMEIIALKEEELRTNLKVVRQAIKDYRQEARRKFESLLEDNDKNFAKMIREIPPWQFYPRNSMNLLVTGTTTFRPASDTQLAANVYTRVKPVLTHLPVDPFTGQADWRLVYFHDSPADRVKFGSYVIDVAPYRPADYSGPGGVESLGGTRYADF